MVTAGSTTAVDVSIASGLTLPPADEGRVAAAVRVASSAACATLLLVTPLLTVTVHSWYAGRVAVAAARVSVAVAVPELLTPESVNVVAPHPLAVMLLKAATPNVGKTRVIASVWIIGVFRANVNEIAVGLSVIGLDTESAVCWNALATPEIVIDPPMDDVEVLK